MKRLLVITLFLFPSFVEGQEEVPACALQKSGVRSEGLMARIPFNEEIVIIFRKEKCKVMRPFEVFITSSDGQWLLTVARDGSSVSWLTGQKSTYKKEDSSVRPKEEPSSDTTAELTAR